MLACHLAIIIITKVKFAIDTPGMVYIVGRLADVNALADDLHP